MYILIAILLGVLLLLQAWRFVIILILMKATSKIPYNPEYKTLLPTEIPIPVQDAFAKIAGVLEAHNLVKDQDFRIEGTNGFFRIYRDDNERLEVLLLGTEVKGNFSFSLQIATCFSDDTEVFSSNTLPTYLPGNRLPNEIGRFFPDCMPEDLLRLHNEYIAERLAHVKKKELPPDIVKFQEKEDRESLERKIKKGILKRDKDENYLKFSFSYHFSLVSFYLRSREGRPLKHPELITNIPYTRGFAAWINPDSPQAKAVRVGSPEQKKKVKKSNAFLILSIIIFGISIYTYFSHSSHKKRDDFAARRTEYTQYVEEHNRKLYSFGQVPSSPLAASLERIEKWLAVNYPQASRTLRPGLSREQIRQELKDLPLAIPEEMYSLYGWHNGQEPTGKEAELIPAYTFLSLREAVNTYREMRSLGDESWPDNYFPILSFEGSFYVVLCGGDKPDKPGSVLDILLESLDSPSTAYPSIASFMQEIAEYFDSGAYYMDAEGYLTVNRDKLIPVFKKYHPALRSNYEF